MNELTQFLEELKSKGYSENSEIAYKKDLEDFLFYLQANKLAETFSDVSNERIFRYFISHLADIEKTPKTIARKISALKSFYRFLHESGRITTNIAKNIRPPKVPKKLPKTLTKEEVSALFQVIDQTKPLGVRNSILLRLLFETGLRVSELINISVQDLDFAQLQIKITGKGNKERLIFLSEGLAADIKTYLAYTRPVLQNKSNIIGTKRIFINYKGGELTARGVRKILNTLVDKAGETFNVHPHLLRHTFATIMLENGADIRTVQELLGHKNVKTTEIYTAVSDKLVFEQFQKANARKEGKICEDSKS